MRVLADPFDDFLDEYLLHGLYPSLGTVGLVGHGVRQSGKAGIGRGLPAYVRSDNGPAFVAQAVQQWLGEKGCQTIYIKPGSLRENPYIESINGKLREECLNRHAFANGREAQKIVTGWKEVYN